MQNRVIRLDVYSRQNSDSQQSRIRRRPQGDDSRLAEAIRVLHEQGPRAVCQLWDEVESLQSELEELRKNVKVEPKKEAQSLVDKLR